MRSAPSRWAPRRSAPMSRALQRSAPRKSAPAQVGARQVRARQREAREGRTRKRVGGQAEENGVGVLRADLDHGRSPGPGSWWPAANRRGSTARAYPGGIETDSGRGTRSCGAAAARLTACLVYRRHRVQSRAPRRGTNPGLPAFRPCRGQRDRPVQSAKGTCMTADPTRWTASARRPTPARRLSWIGRSGPRSFGGSSAPGRLPRLRRGGPVRAER